MYGLNFYAKFQNYFKSKALESFYHSIDEFEMQHPCILLGQTIRLFRQ